MATGRLEHLNFTVSDPTATAKQLCTVFDWHIRWQGESIFGGHTIHVGSDDCYVAIYSMGHAMPKQKRSSYHSVGGLNHIAVVVDDLDGTEARVKALGFETFSHADYEPGRRFYFADSDGIDFEVVCYSDNRTM